MNAHAVEAAMLEMDVDGDGTVSFGEFVRWFKAYNADKENRMWKKSVMRRLGKSKDNWRREYRLKRQKKARAQLIEANQVAVGETAILLHPPLSI